MLGLIHWLSKFFKKEIEVLSRIRQSRRHFLWVMCLDAIFSILVVVVVFDLLGPTDWTNHDAFMLKHPGLIPVPVHEFIDFVTRDDEPTYWLGPTEGTLYAYQSNVQGIKVVSYYSSDKAYSLADVPFVTVTTYKNSYVYKSTTHKLVADPDKQLILPMGQAVELDSSTLDGEVVSFPNSPVIVTIDYPKSRYETDLLIDAEKLRSLG